MKNLFPSSIFLRELSHFSERTQEIIDNTFGLILKVLFFRYKRKVREYEETLIIRKKKHRKRKYPTGPLLLKEKDISDVMTLVDFHLNNNFQVDVYSNQDLVSNFGDFTVQDANKYYEEYLMKLDIRDVMGRRIIFTENGKRFLYKEHTAEGGHVVAPENYVLARGKRLSWIAPLLRTTREIYRQVETDWETFLYVGIFSIRMNRDTAYEEIQKNYFLLVARRKSGQPLEFITGYYMESELDLLKHLEPTRPLYREQQQCIATIEKKY